MLSPALARNPLLATSIPHRGYSSGFWVAACYMMLFIIRPWETLIPELGLIKFERIFVAVMLLIVLRDGISLRGQYKSVIAFFGCVVFAALLAVNARMAWEEVYRYLPQVVFFMVMISVIRQQHELNLMIVIFLAAMTLYTGKAHWEYYVHNAHHVAQGVNRLYGIEKSEGDPNALAMHVVCSLPFLLYVFRHRKMIAAHSPSWLRPILLPGVVAYAALGISTVFHTQSRAGMLGLAAFFFLASFAFVRGGKILRAIMLALVCIGATWLLLPENVRGRLRTIWDPSSGTIDAQVSGQGRLYGLYAGLTMFRRHPIAGVGPGNFLDYRVRHVDGVPLIAHNLPGQVLGEFGLIGGIAFALMAYLAFKNTRRTRSNARRFKGNPQMAQHEQLAVACRNVILLLLFFGLALHNNLKYDWLWVIAFAGLNADFAKATASRLARFGVRRTSQTGLGSEDLFAMPPT
ncbi:MAG: O-antigen ligase family protein [Pirellulales bacterium]|nr:O-antigen ligase family protein [Pirellulales bacterium]